MASGSSGRANSGSKGFDFASDNILCSYEDYGNQDSNNGSLSDPGMGTDSAKDFHKSRIARPVYSSPAYSQPEDSVNPDLVAIVERSMKKYSDNTMRFLEGLSSRLSQLELYCYNLDKSIGEMRSELNRDHADADSKLKSLEKHLQEVHRSVQILRDKQELAETQKELAKLQLAQKESSSSSGNSKPNGDRASTPPPETKKIENASDTPNTQLALALPHQVAPPPQSLPPPPQAPPQNMSQQQPYYMSPAQIPNPSGTTQLPQMQYVPSESQGRSNLPQVSQPPTMHTFPQYQEQWSQPLPQQVSVQPQPPPPQQQASVPPQMRGPPSSVYSPYPPSQPSNPPPQEALPNSMPMQIPYSGVPPPVPSHAETVPYGYGGPPGRILQQQPPPQPKGPFGPRPGDGYGGSPQTPAPPSSGYMVYEADGARATHHHPPPQQAHFSQGVYPPNPQRTPPNPQFVQNHPYGELIDKLVNMGFRGDHVASVIQRMEESRQPVDFNSVLDRLNVHSSAGSQRGWSG